MTDRDAVVNPLRITVLGAGSVGVNLALRFTELGHRVTFGARDVGSPKVVAALDRVPDAVATGLGTALEGADLAVLAVPFGAVGDVLDGIGDPGGTILVDATNAVGVTLPEGVADVTELIRRHHPDATVVKAFNTIGAEAFLDPVIDGRACFLPVAGPEPAVTTVRDLAASIGFDAVVIGDLDVAALMEWHARLWIHLAFRVGMGRDFGFAKVHRSPVDGD